MKNVLLAGLYHETHTFLHERLGLNDFDIFTTQDLEQIEGDGSPMDGALQVAKEDKWILHFCSYMRASPGGLVDDEVISKMLNSIDELIKNTQGIAFDGVYLVMHGAMVSASQSDVEGYLVSEIRKRLGHEIPICGVLDLHANVSQTLCAKNTAFVTYRKNPHTDSREAAIDGAHLLTKAMSGMPLASAFLQTPVVWPATGLFTNENPMLELENMARELEKKHDDILFVNVNAGYAFSDTFDTGVSFSAITKGDVQQAKKALTPLYDYVIANKETGLKLDLSPAKLIEEIQSTEHGPIIIAEPADNIGGGSPGDCTGLLRIFTEHDFGKCLIVISDSETAKQLHKYEIGDFINISLGGKIMQNDSPLELEVKLIRLSDGNLTLEDKTSHLASMYGMNIKMGQSALVQYKDTFIIVTSKKTEPFDLGVFRLFVDNLHDFKCIGVKAAVGHKEAFKPIAHKFLSADTVGPCSSNTASFDFKLIRRPIYPLNDL